MSTLTHSEPRADEPAAKPSPSLILELHHRRLDEMLERIAIEIELASWGEARLLFARFRGELEEHIRIEEQVMFPSFEAFGVAAARSGIAFTLFGLYESSGRCVAYVIR